jgi:hypothetical protein
MIFLFTPLDVQIVFTLVSTHLFLTDFQYSTNWKIPNTTQRPRKSKDGEESPQSRLLEAKRGAHRTKLYWYWDQRTIFSLNFIYLRLNKRRLLCE